MEDEEWSLEPSHFSSVTDQEVKQRRKKKRDGNGESDSSSSSSSSSSEEGSSDEDDDDDDLEATKKRSRDKDKKPRKGSDAGKGRPKQSVTLVFSAPTKKGSFIVRRDSLHNSPSAAAIAAAASISGVNLPSSPLSSGSKPSATQHSSDSHADKDDSSSTHTTDHSSGSSSDTSDSSYSPDDSTSSSSSSSSEDEEEMKKRTRKEVARRRKRSQRKPDPSLPETEEQRRRREAREQRRREREWKRERQTQQRVQELQDRVRALLEQQERADRPDAAVAVEPAVVTEEAIDPSVVIDPTADEKGVAEEVEEDPKDFRYVEGEYLQLPHRVLERILIYFRPPELAQLSLVQKAWRRAAESNVLWRAFFRGTKAERYNLSSWKRFYKMCWRRNKIAEEILSTEQTYVQSLQVVVQVFMNPLRDPSNKQIVTHADLKGIFSEIEVILGYNAKLLGELEERMKRWSFDICLGDIFAKMSMFLKVYTQYVNHFNKAITIVARLKRTSEDFRAFLMYSQNRKQCKGLELNAFLIMPVQRIPRYVLLLTDLVKNTHPLHPDYPELSKARTKMQELAAYINIQKREAENIYEVIAIQDKLIGKFENIVVPGRTYVFEGVMVEIQLAPNSKGKIQKMSNTMRKKSLTSSSGNATISAYKKTDHYAFLFNDMIILAKKTGLTSLVNFTFMAKKAKKKLLNNTQQDDQPKTEETFEFELQIQLSTDCTVANAPQATVGTENFSQCFQLFTNDRAWLFAVPTEREKSEWMRVLEKVLGDLAASGTKISNYARSNTTVSHVSSRGASSSTPGSGSDDMTAITSPPISPVLADQQEALPPPSPVSSPAIAERPTIGDKETPEATRDSNKGFPSTSKTESTPSVASSLPSEGNTDASAKETTDVTLEEAKVERNRSRSLMARSNEELRRSAVTSSAGLTPPIPSQKGLGGRRHSFSVNNLFRKKSSKSKLERPQTASPEEGTKNVDGTEGEDDKNSKQRKRSGSSNNKNAGDEAELLQRKESQAGLNGGNSNKDGWNVDATAQEIAKTREERSSTGTWSSRRNTNTTPILSNFDGIGASRLRSSSARQVDIKNAPSQVQVEQGGATDSSLTQEDPNTTQHMSSSSGEDCTADLGSSPLARQESAPS